MYPSSQGEAIPNESGSDAPLGRYKNESLVLTLPDHLDVFAIDYISIWSKKLEKSLAHVEIPAMTLNIPPALEKLGIEPQVG